MTDKEKNEINCVKARIYGNENLEKITIYMEEITTILNLIEKQQKDIERIKEYAYQEVAHINEDMKDYIDDDRIGNKDIIGELKERKEHWKDMERIIEGKENEELYMNWWRYGLYD